MGLGSESPDIPARREASLPAGILDVASEELKSAEDRSSASPSCRAGAPKPVDSSWVGEIISEFGRRPPSSLMEPPNTTMTPLRGDSRDAHAPSLTQSRRCQHTVDTNRTTNRTNKLAARRSGRFAQDHIESSEPRDGIDLSSWVSIERSAGIQLSYRVVGAPITRILKMTMRPIAPARRADSVGL